MVQSIPVDTRNTQQTPNFRVPSGEQLNAQRQEWARAELDAGRTQRAVGAARSQLPGFSLQSLWGQQSSNYF